MNVAAFVALGANLASHAGRPVQTLRAGLAHLAAAGMDIVKVSRFYASPAWPDPADPEFVNAVAKIRTALSPGDLLQSLHATETAFGRTRSTRNAPRTLDLDILDYDSRVEAGPPILPHPRMKSRAFVLIPLAEIAPDWLHPVTGESIAALIDALPKSDLAAIRPLSGKGQVS